MKPGGEALGAIVDEVLAGPPLERLAVHLDLHDAPGDALVTARAPLVHVGAEVALVGRDGGDEQCGLRAAVLAGEERDLVFVERDLGDVGGDGLVSRERDGLAFAVMHLRGHPRDHRGQKVGGKRRGSH